ncbi:MAG: lysophospholipid acyltransferase family protein [Ktedonobacteraceae bacterium]
MNSEPDTTNDAASVSPVASKPSPVLPEKAKKAAKNLYDPYVIPRPLYEAIRCLIAVPVLLLVARIYLRGRHNVPKHGAYLIAANHLAWTDIPLVPLFLPRKVIYMAKEEYFTSKIAWLVRLLGAFPVKRGEGDRQALRTADDQLKKGNVVVLFPEGTRSKTRTLAKAHAGLGMIALRSGVPVVPVAIWGSENILKQFRPPVTISYGEPMVFKPKGAKITREDIDNATEEVMRAVAAMLPPEYRGAYNEQQNTL